MSLVSSNQPDRFFVLDTITDDRSRRMGLAICPADTRPLKCPPPPPKKSTGLTFRQEAEHFGILTADSASGTHGGQVGDSCFDESSYHDGQRHGLQFEKENEVLDPIPESGTTHRIKLVQTWNIVEDRQTPLQVTFTCWPDALKLSRARAIGLDHAHANLAFFKGIGTKDLVFDEALPPPAVVGAEKKPKNGFSFRKLR